MSTVRKNILVGLLLACLPVPIILHSGSVVIFDSLRESIAFYTLAIGAPTLFLLFGYKQAELTKEYSRSSFLKASLVVGLAIGLIVIVPAALLFHFFGPDIPRLHLLSQLVGVLSLTTALSLLYSSIFWGAAIRPLLNGEASTPSKA